MNALSVTVAHTRLGSQKCSWLLWTHSEQMWDKIVINK